jgi:dipeptidyl aminopeptidase/acylaminoacyl peptidase
MNRNQWIDKIAMVGIAGYWIYTFCEVLKGVEPYWSSLILPILLIIGLRKHNYTGWILLMANLMVQSLLYLWIVVRDYVYIQLKWVDPIEKAYLMLDKALLVAVGFTVAAICIYRRKEDFAGKMKKYPDGLMKFLMILVAIGIPFLPSMEPRIKLALDPTVVKMSNADSGHRIEQIVFSKGDKIIAAAQYRTKVMVWDLKKSDKRLFPAKSYVHSIAASPDGTHLLVGRVPEEHGSVFDPNDAGIDVWNWDTGEKVELRKSAPLDTKKPSSAASQIIFSPDNIHFAVGRGDEVHIDTIEIWNLQTDTVDRILPVGGFIDILNGRADDGGSIAYSPDGRFIAVAGKVITLWDVSTGKCVAGLKSTGELMSGEVAYSPDGRYLAFAVNKFIGEEHKEQGMIEIWEPAAQRLIRTLKWDSFLPVYSVKFSPDGKYIAAGGGGGIEGGTVRIWKVASGAVATCMKYPEYSVQSIAFSPDGSRLAIGGISHVKVWKWQ